jgi:hypothetical protein
MDPDAIQPSDAVRDRGIWLDSKLTLPHRIAKVAAACYCYLHRLKQIRRCVGRDITARLIVALILLQSNYYSSMLASLPGCTTLPLQRVQNSVARLVFSLRPRDHVTHSLIQLQWLLVQTCIEFKLCTLHNHVPHQIWSVPTLRRPHCSTNISWVYLLWSSFCQ